MKKIQVKTSGLVLLALLCTLLSCSKGSSYTTTTPPPAGGGGGGTNTGNAVSISGNSFSPSTISIKAGSSITWTNNDSYSHTVTADDGSFDSGNLGAGKSYTKTFTYAGSYPYHCTIHSNMTATVTVTQ